MAEPEEVSSKRPVSVFRQVVPSNRPKGRDPRFDPTCGEFSESHFQSHYEFVYDIKKKEVGEISKQLKKTKNVDEKTQLKEAKKILSDQIKQRETQAEKQKVKSERRKKEAELVKQGKNPYFLKRSAERSIELENKYNKLKEEGKLNKYLEKKARRKAGKDKKNFYLNSDFI